jgi:DNA-binding MarR family transcriptional regulator
MQPFFTGYGISGSQWGVLRVLYRAEGEGFAGLRLTDLGDRLLIRPPSVTAVVGRLQHLGLVARQPAPDDQRARQISLTPAGRKLVDRVMADHARRVEAVLAGLSMEEQKYLFTMLEKLGAHVTALTEREATAPERS